ncbi:Mce family protein [Nocardia sp. 852002-20019_SCH5090214]|jgi:phospholipid/cholesterol/gamma-HCH transport system substrate-binding protein|uniref:MCE family protein n=1 Tax=Nocardia TaxID=1817 RepID=UPI00068958C3|nr:MULTISPECIES: MCE family protein [Nocardia]MBF6144581.1 MCE family protein [Nocardia nova]MBV7702265.1 MCE family protein [Nocardia nova]MDN2496339.1 MCE family protein [Nocardia nova]OBA66647.1 Mce family protein [Nocardia sp. 852002-20019_SCH5090214]PPI95264.1 MCE family protein [Nocardia nova]
MAANKLVEKEGAGKFFGAGWGVKLSGVALILFLAAIVAVALTMFVGGFSTSKPVYLDAPRAGLVMDKDAKVKIRGVQIGHVSDIAYTGDQARLTLAIEPDQLKMVPANATVDIRSTTVFGAKYVNFVEPEVPSAQHLQAGATLTAQSVTVEFNTLFQHLTDVLGKIAPEKLNATLTALGTALQGRGDKLGQLLVDSDEYLRDINPSLPDLQRDLQTSVGVTNLYADTAPNLLRTTDNAAVTSKTIVDHQDSLDAVLLNLIGLADTTGAVLKENENGLSTALDLLRPTAELLNEYNPALYCLVEGVAGAIPRANEIFGGTGPWVTLNASFMPGGTPYTYPKDLPKVNATGGPHCEGILDRKPGSHANYLVTDTTEGRVYTPELSTHLNGPRVFQLLFAGLPGVGNP